VTDTRPPPPSSSSSRGHWILIGILLTPAVVLPLLVGLYDRTDPEVFGFPFYFWSQMMMIPMAVVLTIIAYYLAKVAERRDHDNRREAGR